VIWWFWGVCPAHKQETHTQKMTALDVGITVHDISVAGILLRRLVLRSKEKG
jgi:hypothetical protein